MLGRISARIVNEVRGVNRVIYDISSKPPGLYVGKRVPDEFRKRGAANPIKYTWRV